MSNSVLRNAFFLPDGSFSLHGARRYFAYAREMFTIDMKGWDDARVSFDENTDGYFFVHGNSLALIEHNRQVRQMTVLFNPTRTMGDWLDNLVPFYSQLKTGGSTLSGFHIALDRKGGPEEQPLCKRVLAKVRDIADKHQIDKINFSGYSRGGAMAALFIARAFYDGLHKQISFGDFYTYGAPYIGDEEFFNASEAIREETGLNAWRIETDLDPVPGMTDYLNHPIGNLAVISAHPERPGRSVVSAYTYETEQDGFFSRLLSARAGKQVVLGHQNYAWGLGHVSEVLHYLSPERPPVSRKPAAMEPVLFWKLGGAGFPVPRGITVPGMETI